MTQTVTQHVNSLSR